ncbi:heat shock protein HtpX [compost metagenome]
MVPFILIFSAIFFVLGGLILALPWKGVVALVERAHRPAVPQDRHYALLLVLPLVILIGFVTVILGPWETEVCQALQDACLERITAWQLPWEVGVALGIVGIVAVGRMIKPYLARRGMAIVPMPAGLKAKWQLAKTEAERCSGMRLPPLVLVREPEHLLQVKGLSKPTLVLSETLLRELDPDELVGALCHEAAHLKRGDLWLGFALYLCQCLLFFMPTSRQCYQRYLDERERAADEWAIARTGKPLALASALTKVAQLTGHGPALVRVERLLEGTSRLWNHPRFGVAALTFSLLVAGLGLPFLSELHHPLESWGRNVLMLLGVLA